MLPTEFEKIIDRLFATVGLIRAAIFGSSDSAGNERGMRNRRMQTTATKTIAAKKILGEAARTAMIASNDFPSLNQQSCAIPIFT